MEEKKLKHGTPEYWRDWYWNRGGRDKVQYSRKVTQVLRKIEAEKAGDIA